MKTRIIRYAIKFVCATWIVTGMPGWKEIEEAMEMRRMAIDNNKKEKVTNVCNSSSSSSCSSGSSNYSINTDTNSNEMSNKGNESKCIVTIDCPFDDVDEVMMMELLVVLGRPASNGRRAEDVNWDELREAACMSDDEHTQKVVFVCYDRYFHEQSCTIEKRMSKFVAWKRLTDEQPTLFQ